MGHHILHKEGAAGEFLKKQAASGGSLSPLEQSDLARLESEADLFASYLLIPEAALRPLLESESLENSDDPVTQLAIEFQVPTDAMRVRLVYEACKGRTD